MKVAILAFLVGGSGFATSLVAEEQARPILRKEQHALIVGPKDFKSFYCDVFSDRLEIVRTFGSPGVSTREVRPWKMEGDLQQMIKMAKGEKFISFAALCEWPSVRITASQEGVGENDILLYSFNTCEADGKREGDYSTILTNFVNAACGGL